jgi:hypothetical protein
MEFIASTFKVHAIVIIQQVFKAAGIEGHMDIIHLMHKYLTYPLNIIMLLAVTVYPDLLEALIYPNGRDPHRYYTTREKLPKNEARRVHQFINDMHPSIYDKISMNQYTRICFHIKVDDYALLLAIDPDYQDISSVQRRAWSGKELVGLRLNSSSNLCVMEYRSIQQVI